MSQLSPATGAALSPKEQDKLRKAEMKAEAERNKQEAKERAAQAKLDAKEAAKREKEAKAAAKKGLTVTPVNAPDALVVDVNTGTSASLPKATAVHKKGKIIVEASAEEAARAPPPPSSKAAPPPPAQKSAPPPPAQKSAPPPPAQKAPAAATTAPATSKSGGGEKKDDKGYVVPPPPPADPPPKRNKKYRVELKAKYDYQAMNPDEISLKKGSRYWGFELMENNSWWYGEDQKTKQRGLFPINYAVPLDLKVREELAAMTNTGRGGGGEKKEADATKLKLTLYAHNLAYATSFFCLVFGAFGSLWWAEASKGNISQLKRDSLIQPVITWVYSLGMGGAVYVYEYLYGLVRKKTPSPYVSPRGIVFLCASAPLWAGYPTMLPAACSVVCGLVNCLADYNREEGDARHVKGSYFVVWFDSEKEGKSKKNVDEEELTWVEKAREKGVLAQNLIVVAYFAINAVLMTDACIRWYRTVKLIQISCVVDACPSDLAIVAKTFGQMLNFNCAVVVFPVLKSALRWANNKEVRPGKSLAAYIPLRKNIIFHRLVTSFIFVGVMGHVTAHYINFAFAPEFTLFLFGSSPWFTGAACTFSMVLIYSGAQNRVKRANYEIFWVSHHFFLLFFFTLLAHGPDFWAWACVPLLCYVADRIYRVRAGIQPFYLRRVLYIPPVMELSFYPAQGWSFREGQYLYLLAPHLSSGEWHPFTISSAAGDLESKEKKEVTCHIRVQGPKSWTRRLMEYFALMTHSSKKKGDSFLLELWHYNSNGEVEPGKYLGPDGLPLISVDGPHAAPAQQYTYYPEVMLVGAGIGLTPSSSILKAICRHKWKKGFLPHVIYFYWVVRQDEIESFRWFVNILVELEKRLASDRHAGALSSHHYIELNIYVTAAPKPGGPVVQPKKLDLPFMSAHEMNVGYDVDVGFDEEKLMRALLNPKAPAAKQRAIQGGEQALPDGTRLSDIWIWNGRPKWDDIFLSVKEQRDTSTNAIGCCFCGTPVIGKDLKKHCQEQSSITERFRFDLHKENF